MDKVAPMLGVKRVIPGSPQGWNYDVQSHIGESQIPGPR